MISDCPLCKNCVSGCPSRTPCSCSYEKVIDNIIPQLESKDIKFDKDLFTKFFIQGVNAKLRGMVRYVQAETDISLESFVEHLHTIDIKGIGKDRFCKYIYDTMFIIVSRENRKSINMIKNKEKNKKPLTKKEQKLLEESKSRGKSIVKGYIRKYKY